MAIWSAGKRRGGFRVSWRVACSLAFGAVVILAGTIVLPATLPSLVDALRRSPAAPLLVAMCWAAATSASIAGKRIMAAGHLGWAGVATAHITGTVANRVVPAGAGAAGAFLAALRRGGASAAAATGMVAVWGITGGVAHATGLLIGAAWLRGGWPTLAMALLALGLVIIIGTVVLARIRGAGTAAHNCPISCPPAQAKRPHSTIRQAVQARASTVAAFAREVLAAVRARPAHAAVALTAQVAAMGCLSVGFATAATSVGLPITAGAGMAAYVIGVTMSSTAPTPAGIGSAEVALVGALVIAGATVSEALPTVLLFRAVVLIAPVVIAAVLASGWLLSAQARRLH